MNEKCPKCGADKDKHIVCDAMPSPLKTKLLIVCECEKCHYYFIDNNFEE